MSYVMLPMYITFNILIRTTMNSDYLESLDSKSEKVELRKERIWNPNGKKLVQINDKKCPPLITALLINSAEWLTKSGKEKT